MVNRFAHSAVIFLLCVASIVLPVAVTFILPSSSREVLGGVCCGMVIVLLAIRVIAWLRERRRRRLTEMLAAEARVMLYGLNVRIVH